MCNRGLSIRISLLSIGVYFDIKNETGCYEGIRTISIEKKLEYYEGIRILRRNLDI